MIHDRIRQRRLALGLTQLDLAKRLGISKSAVSHWEKHRNLPENANLEPVAVALECDPGWLLTGEERPSSDRVAHGLVGPEGIVTLDQGPADAAGPQLGPALVMLLVKTDVLAPRILPGDLLYMTVRPCSPQSVLGSTAVCRMPDGRLLLRRLEPSATSAHLVTLAATGRQPMSDLEIAECHPIMALVFPSWRELRPLVSPPQLHAEVKRGQPRKSGPGS